MKAKLVDSMPTGKWIYEIKFDGYRALALRGASETRVLPEMKRTWCHKSSEQFSANCNTDSL
jgi:bifunctional non-homologous end joining protein LigD